MELTICVGESCHLKGAEIVVKTFQTLIKKENLGDKINLKGSFCMGQCTPNEVTVQIDKTFYKTRYQESEAFFYNTLFPLLKN